MNRWYRSGVCAMASGFYLTYPLERFAKQRKWRQSGAGIIGSLFGVACVPILPEETIPCLLTLLGCLFLSVAISDAAEESLGKKDDQRIVIDEWVGYLLAVALLPKTAVVVIVGFILFRILDTFKPLGLNALGKYPGGWGVILDDVAAGLLANAILRISLLLT